MRFLFVHQNFPGQYRHVAPALARQGHEVVGLGSSALAEAPAGVRHVRYEPPASLPMPPPQPQRSAMADWQAKVARGEAAAAAMRRLRAEGFVPDVVVVHPGWGEALFARDVFPRARLVTFAEYFYGGPGSDTEFDPEFQEEDSEELAGRLRIKNTHLLHALNDCDLAISPTQFQKSRHPAWAHERIQVVHEGIDTERIRPDPGAVVHLKAANVALRAGEEIVTFVARNLEPYRGYHVFMRALPELQRLRPQARVVVVGGDDTSYGARPPAGKTWRNIFLAEVVQRLDLSRVHFVGHLPHALLTQLMQVSRAHVYLTYPFVLSWSMLEAMSAGCLVVGSDTAPVREVIEPGRNGLLVPFFDPRQLASTVADALAAGDGVQALRTAARQTIVDRYELRRCVPRQLELLAG